MQGDFGFPVVIGDHEHFPGLGFSWFSSPVQDAFGGQLAFVAGDDFLTQIGEDGYISP